MGMDQKTLGGVALPAVRTIESCHKFSRAELIQTRNGPERGSLRINPINAPLV